MKKRMSWLIINLLILLSELSTCSCFDEPEGLPKAVLATSYTDGACTIREEVNDTRDGTICHILGKCYSITNGVWDDEAGLMYAVYGKWKLNIVYECSLSDLLVTLGLIHTIQLSA